LKKSAKLRENIAFKQWGGGRSSGMIKISPE